MSFSTTRVLTAMIIISGLLVSCGDDSTGGDFSATNTWQVSYDLGRSFYLNSVCESEDGRLVWAGRGWHDGWDTTDGDSVRVNQRGLLLIKTNFLGDTNWTRVIGDSVSAEYGSHIIPASVGGYVVACNYDVDGGDATDIRLRKITVDGEPEWEARFTMSAEDSIARVAEALDGGYIMAGNSFRGQAGRGYDALAARVSPEGNTEWIRAFGSDETERARNVLALEDSSYLFVGEASKPGDFSTDYYIAKISANGDSLWAVTIDLGGWDVALAARADDSTGYVIYGISYHDLNSIGIVRTDLEGTVLRTTKHTLIDGFQLSSITVTPDSGAIGAGFLSALGTHWGYMLRLSPNDAFEWEMTYGIQGQNSFMEQAIGLSRRGFAAAGRMEKENPVFSMPFMVRTDGDGIADPYVIDSL